MTDSRWTVDLAPPVLTSHRRKRQRKPETLPAGRGVVFALESTAEPGQYRYLGKGGTRLATAVSNLKSQARTGAMHGALYRWIRDVLDAGHDVVGVALPYDTKLEAYAALFHHQLVNERVKIETGNTPSALSNSRASDYRRRAADVPRPKAFDPDFTRLDELTASEARVFELFGEGLSVHDVASDLGVRSSSVYSVTAGIRRKLGVPDHKAVVASALFYFSLPQ